MAAELTTIGEEYLFKNGLAGASFTVGLYNDATDAAGDTTDLGDLTTEPTGTNYARQSMTGSLVENANGNWQVENGSALSFNTDDSSQNVDAYFIVANFQSTTAGDGSATDHIIATGLLSQSRDLSQIDTLELAAGGVGFVVD